MCAELPLHPGLPVFRSLYFLGDYTVPLIHLQSLEGRTMNKSLTTVLRLLFKILFNCCFPWPLSSSQRTPVSPPQTQPWESSLCAFTNTISLPFLPSVPYLTCATGPSSCIISFKFSYIIVIRSFRYKTGKESMSEWMDKWYLPLKGMLHPFFLSIAFVVARVYWRLVAISVHFRKH